MKIKFHCNQADMVFKISGVIIIDLIKITLLAENLLAKVIIINNNVSQKEKDIVKSIYYIS